MNKALWNRVCVTDPKAVKPITGKQYSGNSPKPYWIVERLTDGFGPCGIGWGFNILNERMERLTETDVLHVATVRMWYIAPPDSLLPHLRDTAPCTRGEVEQIGQTKAVYAKKDGALLVDEDAPKKSVTDALVKCASYLGFAGDIFSGRWDDSKYVAEAKKEWDKRSGNAGGAISAPQIAYEGLSDEWRAYIDSLARDVDNSFDQMGADAARSLIDEETTKNDLDPNHLAALQHKIGKSTRAALNKLKLAA